jgi:hypothetical protein
MALIRDLIGAVKLVAPGVPEPVAVKAYIDAARQFFTDTRAWRTAGDRVRRTTSHKPGVGAFTLTPLPDTEIFDAVVTRYDRQPLKKVSLSSMIGAGPGHYGRPSHFVVTRNLLEVVPDPGPGPSVEAMFTVLSCIRPTRDALELDDDIADRFGEIVENGAISRVLSQPKTEWTDLQLAVYYRSQFEDQVNTWRSKASDDGQVGVARRVRYGGY